MSTRVGIVIPYLNRPNMLRKLLKSVKELTYKNWYVGITDDGSVMPMWDIVSEEMAEYQDRCYCLRIEDSVQKKKEQGGSRVGELVNKMAVLLETDITLVVADDDRLTHWGVAELVEWYAANPNVMHTYSNMIPFNPFIEEPHESMKGRPHALNRFNTPINASCAVDGTQVTTRSCVFGDRPDIVTHYESWGKPMSYNGVGYPPVRNYLWDECFFRTLSAAYGPCVPNPVYLQYKAFWPSQYATASRGVDREQEDLPDEQV